MLVLRPSAIHGVGVFTTKALKKGEHLPDSAQTRDWTIIEARTVRGPIARHCTRTRRGRWYAPKDPHRMSVGWYMNHSSRPNVTTDNDDWRTTRYVPRGKELTIDYAAHEAQL